MVPVKQLCRKFILKSNPRLNAHIQDQEGTNVIIEELTIEHILVDHYYEYWGNMDTLD